MFLCFYFNLTIHFYNSVSLSFTQKQFRLNSGGNVNRTESNQAIKHVDDQLKDFSFILDQIQSIKNRFLN